jgi:hypothetical protein
MRLNEFIKDLSTSEKHSYAEEIWQLINHTYKDLGLYGASLSNLLQTAGKWKVEVSQDNHIIAGALFRNLKGNKLRLVFHNGSSEGKLALKRIMKETLINGNGYWGEISGPLEQSIIKLGAKPVPSKFAEEILDLPIDQYEKDGIHYYRNIEGHLKIEAIYGKPIF